MWSVLISHKHREEAATKHYAGLDVSLEETSVYVVDENGRIVEELRALSELPALIAAIERLGLPLEGVGLEACSLTAWLHDGLRDAGLPAICIEMRQAGLPPLGGPVQI